MKKFFALSLVALMGLSACTNFFDGINNMPGLLPTDYDFITVAVNVDLHTQINNDKVNPAKAQVKNLGVIVAGDYFDANQNNFLHENIIRPALTYVQDGSVWQGYTFHNNNAYLFKSPEQYLAERGVLRDHKVLQGKVVFKKAEVKKEAIDMEDGGLPWYDQNVLVYTYVKEECFTNQVIAQIPQDGVANMVEVDLFIASATLPRIGVKFKLNSFEYDNPDGSGYCYISPIALDPAKDIMEQVATTGCIKYQPVFRLDANGQYFATGVHLYGMKVTLCVPLRLNGEVNFDAWDNNIVFSGKSLFDGSYFESELPVKSATKTAVLANLQTPNAKSDYYPEAYNTTYLDKKYLIPVAIMDQIDANIGNCVGFRAASAAPGTGIKYYPPQHPDRTSVPAYVD